MELIVVGLVGGGISAAIGWWIAGQKGRGELEGALLGFFLGPIGWIVEALLPTQLAAPPSQPTSSPIPSTYASGPVRVAPPPRPSRVVHDTAPAVGERATKRCPDCAEDVFLEARICHRCRHAFPAMAAEAPVSETTDTESSANGRSTIDWPPGQWVELPDGPTGGRYLVETVATGDPALLPAWLFRHGATLRIEPRGIEEFWVSAERYGGMSVALQQIGASWTGSASHPDLVIIADRDGQPVATLRRVL